MGYVIANASSKGGCGKSTLTVALAGIYAKSGISVLIIDADARKRLAEEWYDPTRLPASISVLTANHDNLTQTIRDQKSKYDVILVDVEGTASLTLAQAVHNADFVLIPANVSTQDLRDAAKVVEYANDINADSRKKRAIGVVWNRVLPAIRSREMTQTMQSALESGLPILFTVHERDAYKALFSFSTVLDRLTPAAVPSAPKAEQEILRLAEAIGTAIEAANNEEAA